MTKQITFIDLFAGIGGFHLALESLGAKCVFASEIDESARKTYIHNFSKHCPELFQHNLFNQDIRNVHYQDIPDFDILCAGFPCQPFSQAGYKQGFEDTQERGNLFYVIADIISEKQPAAIFLENVRHLVNHDKGNTFKTIRHILEDELHYSFHYKVVKASDFGLPQHRPRVFIVGFKDEEILSQFAFPKPIPLEMTMTDIWGAQCNKDIGFTLRVGGKSSPLDDRRNWDGYLVNGEEKRLSPKEGKKMQGFPDEFEFPVSRTQAMKQLGNSVAVPVVKHIAAEIIHYLQKK